MSRVLRHRSLPPLGVALCVLVLLGACARPGTEPSASTPTSQATPGTTTTPSVRPATAAPTPVPTPAPETWKSLAWTRVDKTFTFSLTAVSAWKDGYVGIGLVWDAEDRPAAAFFASADGMAWTLAQSLAPGEEQTPVRLLVTHDGLLAVLNVIDPAANRAHPQLWHSTDGRTWQELSSPTWAAAWAAGSRLMNLASGPAGVVAVGGGAAGAAALFSADDGRSWQVTTLAADSGSQARGVVATAQGFVAVGVIDGEWDTQLIEVLHGRSAAWVSADGRSWQPAGIQPTEDADRLTFTGVHAATEGLLAIASDTSGSVPGQPGEVWASADGRRWQPLGRRGEVVPAGDLRGDGVRMLILGTGDWSPFGDTPWPGYVSGWTSLDGRTWMPVSFSGQLMDQESADGWWLTDRGLVFSGSSVIWVATAG